MRNIDSITETPKTFDSKDKIQLLHAKEIIGTAEKSNLNDGFFKDNLLCTDNIINKLKLYQVATKFFSTVLKDNKISFLTKVKLVPLFSIYFIYLCITKLKKIVR